jgi:chromosome segregation ATPase
MWMELGDLQGLVVGIVVVIICALLVWAITSLTVRERPFEERLEQQRRMENALLQLDSLVSTPSQKKDKLKKKNKKQKSAEHEDVAPAHPGTAGKIENEPKKPVKMVELEIEPEVIETLPDEPTITTGKKKKASKTATPSPSIAAAKPILINREEKSAVRMTEETPEIVHRRSTPKDAVELKHDRDRRQSDVIDSEVLNGLHAEPAPKVLAELVEHQPSKVSHARLEPTKAVVVEQPLLSSGQDVGGKTTGRSASRDKVKKQHRDEVELSNGLENVREVIIKAQTAAPVAVAPPLPSSEQAPKKKAKTNGPSTQAVARSKDIEHLVELTEKANLDDTDVHRLIDILCSKLPNADAAALLTASGEWSKKGQKDPLQVLLKQVEEKKKETEEEKLRTQTANEKVRELQGELADIRQKMTAVVKQNTDHIASQRQDNANLSARLQQQEGTVAMLKAQLDTMKAQLTESHTELQRVKAENMHLVTNAQQFANSEALMEEMRQKVKVMDDALKSNAVKYNQCDNMRKSLEVSIKHYERESQMMVQRYSETPDELHKAQVHNQSLLMEIEHLKATAQCFEKELAVRYDELKVNENKLHDVSRQKAEVEGRLRLADTQVTELANTIRQKDVDVQALRAQLCEMLAELKQIKDIPVNARGDVGEELVQKKTCALLNESMPASGNAEELLRLSSRLETSLNEKKVATDEADVLRQQLADKLAELEALRRAGEDKTAAFTSAIADLDRTKGELQAKSAEVDRLVTELEVLRQDNAKCEEMKTSLVTLTGQLQSMEAERAASESQLHEKEAMVSRLEADLNQTKDSLREIESRLHKRDEEFAQIEGDLLRQKEGDASSSQTEVELGERLRQKEAEFNDIQSRLNQKEADHADAERRLHEKETAFTDVESALHAKATLCTDIEARLQEKTTSYDDLESRLRGKESEYEQAAARLRELDAKNETLIKELETVKEQLAAVISDQERVTSELTKSLSTIEALQGASNSASQLESELDRRAQELNQLRAELEQLRDANASLQKLVDEMKAEKVESLGNTLTSEETEKLRTALEERDKEIMVW